MNITETLFHAWNFRHACKVFDANKRISEEDFTTILEAGRLSPSSFGFEPWKFLVVQNMELRKAMLPFCWGGQGQLPTASHVVALLARKPEAVSPDCAYVQTTIMQDTQKLPSDMATQRVEKFRAFLRDDFAYVGNERAGFEWAARQCYIALGNMMTAAALLGIDSCPIEGFNKAAMEKLLTERDLLDTRVFGLAVMVAFGQRIKEPRPKTRRPASCVVRWVK